MSNTYLKSKMNNAIMTKLVRQEQAKAITLSGSSWLAIKEHRDFITTGWFDSNLWFLATKAGLVEIVTSVLWRANLRDLGKSGCCGSGSSDRECRQLTRLADASATRKTVFQVRNFIAQQSIGSKGSSRKAWRTRARFHWGTILGVLCYSISKTLNNEDRIGSVPGFQPPCSQKTYL